MIQMQLPTYANTQKEASYEDVLDEVRRMKRDTKYGLAYTNGDHVTNPDDWNKLDAGAIVIQSPDQLKASGIGMCHDVTRAIHEFLQKNRIKHQAVMLKGTHKPDLPTHSFVVVQNDAGTYDVLDPLSYADAGIYNNASFKDAQKVAKDHWKTEGNKGRISSADIPDEDWKKTNLLDFLGYTKQAFDISIKPFRSWGNRYNPSTGKMDGAPKHDGWQGLQQLESGDVATEVGVTAPHDGKDEEIPQITPDTTKEQLDEIKQLAAGKIKQHQLSQGTRDQALKWAERRWKEKKSPFYNGAISDWLRYRLFKGIL